MISLNSLHWKIIYDDPLTMVYRPSYPWYFNPLLPMVYQPPTHCILTPLLMVYRRPTRGILTPYLWYTDPLLMVYRPPYPWYSDPLPMVFWSPTHGTSTPLSMVFWPPYPWYFDPLSMVFWPPAYTLIRNEGSQNTMGVQFTIQGVKIPYDTGPFFIHDLSPDL